MKILNTSFIIIIGTFICISCGGDDAIETNKVTLAQEALDVLASNLSSTLNTDNATGATISTDWTDNLDGANRPQVMDTVEVIANISENTTWTSDKVYLLTQRITVLNGVTLTINPGTTVAGQAGNDADNAATLMIARGAKLMAEGTADNPIVFTSSSDNGNSTLSKENTGLWGGLVLLGYAQISTPQVTNQIEGVPSDDENGIYGGTDDTDNSGILTYISVRHGGSEIFGGSEINGLTLGGVGSGTVIENIHVFANADDGIEFFGGSVNASNLFVEFVDDDAIDIDQAYSGTISNYLIYVDATSDEALEVDGREGTLDKSFTLQNGTVESADNATITSEFKSKAKAEVTNLDHKGAVIKLLASFEDDDLTLAEDAANNALDGNLTFTETNATYELVAELSDATKITAVVE